MSVSAMMATGVLEKGILFAIAAGEQIQRLQFASVELAAVIRTTQLVQLEAQVEWARSSFSQDTAEANLNRF